MRFFVTGGSGFVGSAVVTELRAAGHDVTGLARSAAAATRLTELGAAVVPGSMSDPTVLTSAAAASDGVIHLAFRHGDPYAEAAETDRRVIQTLGAALAGSDRPLVVTSGTLVLPAGRVVTEDDSPEPAAPAAARMIGVRSAVVRLAPSVHDRVKRGFAGALIDAAARSGFAGYLGDGAQRWPAVHRQDAARLFRLAAERAPAGSVLHGVAEEGVTLRSIAELIGAKLNLPARPVAPEEAPEYFGWLATLAGTDCPAASPGTRSLLAWQPSGPGLLEDLRNGDFFTAVTPAPTSPGGQR